MIRTGDEYRASIRDGREVYIDGERRGLFYRHTRAATFIRATLHRYSAFPFVQRVHALIKLFAQSPPFAQLAAVYRTFDWQGPLDVVRYSAGLSERVTGRRPEAVGT